MSVPEADNSSNSILHLTFCMLGNYLCLLPFFQNDLFLKKNERILSERQTVWIQIRTCSVGPDPSPNCLQRLSADDKSHPYLG